MSGKKKINSDAEIQGKVIVYTVPNGTGTVITYNPTTKEFSTRTNAELISDLSLVTTNTGQDIIGQKWFKNSTGTSNWNDHKLIVFGEAGSKAGMSFYSAGMDIGTIDFDGYFHFKNSGSNYVYIKSNGFIKNGSDDSYLLLGGGGHVPLSNFLTSTNYRPYEDNRQITPSEISPMQLAYGFTTWDNNNNYPYGDFIHFGGYTDSSGGAQNLIVFKKNGYGLRQYQGNWQDVSPYSGHVDYWHSGDFTQANVDSWNNVVGTYVTINTPQEIEARKIFRPGIGNRYDEASLELRGSNANSIYPTLSFHQPGVYAGTISLRNSNQFSFRNTDDSDYNYLLSKGYIKSGSDDSYFLLGGGGHLSVSSKLNAWENAYAVGFSAGLYPTDFGNEYPYMYHGNPGSNTPYIPLATQGFVISRAWIQSGRNFPSGTLIRTNIDYSQSEGAAWMLEMKGNMYGGGMVMDCKVQGYIYANTLINVNGYSTHPLLTEIIATNLNGELCFWFPSLTYWQGFTVKVTDVTNSSTTTVNRAYEIANSADQGGTKRVTIPIQTIATRDWVNAQGFAVGSLDKYLRDRDNYNTGLIAKTDYPNSVTYYAGDPATTGFQSYYGNSLHLFGTIGWYNRLDFPTSAEKLFLYQGINTTDMYLRGYLDIIPAGVTNWTSNSFNPDTKVNKSGDTMTGNLNLSGASIGINSGQKIALKGLSDGSHYISHFPNDDSVGFGINTFFAIKAYNDPSINYFATDIYGNSYTQNTHRAKKLIANYPTSTSGQNLGSGGIGNTLELRNYDAYGTNFWTNDNGWGFIQQQRFDGNPVAYRLVLQPLGGQLFYGNNEVATVNQIPSTSNFVTTDSTPQNKSGNLGFVNGANIRINGADSNWIQSYRETTGNVGIVAGFEYAHYATRWKVGNRRGSSTDSLGFAFEYSTDNGASYTSTVVIGTDSNIFTQQFGAASQWYQAYLWGNHATAGYLTSASLAGYATESWVSTYYIPKTHPVYNITQTNINSWNNAVTYAHQHWNFAYLDNIDQYLGTGQSPRFATVNLMNYLGYGQLVLGEDNYGGEYGLVDLTNERFYAGRKDEYIKYGSSITDFEAINVHFDAKLVAIGKEITNDEDKVQVAGNISVNAFDINANPTDLILNPLYNRDGDVRFSRNAHIYIDTGNTVILPQKPILGQRIEIYNFSDSDIAVTHDTAGTLFYVAAFSKKTGIVGGRGFRFDEKEVLYKQYDI